MKKRMQLCDGTVRTFCREPQRLRFFSVIAGLDPAIPLRDAVRSRRRSSNGYGVKPGDDGNLILVKRAPQPAALGNVVPRAAAHGVLDPRPVQADVAQLTIAQTLQLVDVAAVAPFVKQAHGKACDRRGKPNQRPP
jgi:hypothetical protein